MNRRERQLFYMRRAWRGLRDQVLRAEPFCRRCCDEDGKLVPATEVDHITPLKKDPSLALARENLAPLCKPCHSAKTLSEATGRPVQRKRQKIWGVNADGTPRDPEHAWNAGVKRASPSPTRESDDDPTSPAPAAAPVETNIRRVPPSGAHISRLGPDAQHQHAARLLISGYDVESAAVLSGLTVDEVREIAQTVDTTAPFPSSAS